MRNGLIETDCILLLHHWSRTRKLSRSSIVNRGCRRLLVLKRCHQVLGFIVTLASLVLELLCFVANERLTVNFGFFGALLQFFNNVQIETQSGLCWQCSHSLRLIFLFIQLSLVLVSHRVKSVTHFCGKLP